MSITNPSEFSFVGIADLHLKDRESIGDINADNLSVRTLQKLDALSEAVSCALYYGVDAFISLGDIFDSTRISERLRYEVLIRLQDLIYSGIDIYFVGGNHDTTDNITYSLLSESTMIEGIMPANNLVVETNKGVDLLFIASGKEDEIIKFSPNKPTILFSHCQIEGAKYDNEKIGKSFIALDSLTKFHSVYLGHFHKRQRKGNCRYIGALCRNSFNEKGNPTGFVYVRLKGDRIREERYNPINDLDFVQFDKSVSSEKEIIEFIESLSIEGKVVKIRLSLLEPFKVHPRRIKEIAKSKNPFDVVIEYNREKTIVDSSIKSNLSYMDAFSKYTSLNKVSKEIEEVGRKILEKTFNT